MGDMMVICHFFIDLYGYDLVGGFNLASLKNDGRIVSWDDDIPNSLESHNPAMFQSPPTRLYIM